MFFRMKSSIFAGDKVLLNGIVDDIFAEGVCGASVAISISITVDDRLATTCEALFALPVWEGDEPWTRRGDQWLRPD